MIKKPLGTGPISIASLRSLGYRTTDPPTLDNEFLFAHRHHLIFAKKGEVRATIWVLDYAEAAAGKKSALRIQDRKILVIAGKYDVQSAVDSLAREIAGK